MISESTDTVIYNCKNTKGINCFIVLYVRPNKIICLVPVTCPKKVGRVGRHFFLFYLFIYLLMLSEGYYNNVILMYSLCD